MTKPINQDLITITRQRHCSFPQRLVVDRFGRFYGLDADNGHCPGALALFRISSAEARKRFPDAFIDGG